jgi:hypothetical protein
MKKLIMIFMCFLLLTACASTKNQTRTAPFNQNNKEYTTYIKDDDGPFGANLFLYVNDQQIATGTITAATPQTVFSGQYDGIKFDAECAASKSGGINMVKRCTIYAKGQKIAEFQW